MAKRQKSDRLDDDGQKARLRLSSKRPSDTRDTAACFAALRRFQRVAGAAFKSERPQRGPRTPQSRNDKQRAIVRLRHEKNRGDGSWRAHGRYIERGSATIDHAPDGRPIKGFNREGAISIPDTLRTWEQSGDPRIFKLILSPEFGDKLDMREFTNSYMAKLERDLGIPLEWCAAIHYDTDNPHTHVTLRGVDRNGNALTISPEYIKKEMRERVRDAATEQLGLRTEQDIIHAHERQVTQNRFTDLDRAIKRRGEQSPSRSSEHYILDLDDVSLASHNQIALRSRNFQIRRLQHLEAVGLAESLRPNVWAVRTDFEKALRLMQESGDRLKLLNSHREMISNPSLPLQVPDFKEKNRVTGKLIATGLDENSNQPYFLLEGTDSTVYYIRQIAAMQLARGVNMKMGNLLTISAREYADPATGQMRHAIRFRDHGAADDLVKDSIFMEKAAVAFVRDNGSLPPQSNHNGWLGEFQNAMHESSTRLLRDGSIKPAADGRYEAVNVRRSTEQDQAPRR